MKDLIARLIAGVVLVIICIVCFITLLIASVWFAYFTLKLLEHLRWLLPL